MLNVKNNDSLHRKAEIKIQDKINIATNIFNEHSNIIRTIIHSVINDTSKADDIFQSFFLSIVYKPIPQSIQNIRGYIHRAIINDIRDAIRRTTEYQNQLKKYAECHKFSGTEEQPQVRVARTEEYQKIVRLIEKELPRREAEAVLLRYNHDKNTRDAAEKMCVSKRTYSGYLCEGLRKIRRIVCDKHMVDK